MPQQTYLIKLSPDKVINDSASTYRKYYSLPQSHKFVPAGETSGKADAEWTVLQNGSLGVVTGADKLLIVAHGSSTTVAGRTVNKLLSELNDWGLAQVDEIVFKCCDVGRKDFLERFVKRAYALYHMKIGMVQGYRGTAMTLPLKPYELISHDSGRGFKFGSRRYKSVPGLNAFFTAKSFQRDE